MYLSNLITQQKSKQKPNQPFTMNANNGSSSKPRASGNANNQTAGGTHATTNNSSSNGYIESSIRDNRSTRTTFECHSDEILEAIAIVSGLCISTQGNESSNPQEDSSSSSQHHPPTIVESVLSEFPSSTPTVETTDNILRLVDDTILFRTGHTPRQRDHRARRRTKSR